MIDIILHVHNVSHHDEEYNPLPDGPIHQSGDEALIYARLDAPPTSSNFDVLAEGPSLLPQSVTRRQGKQKLVIAGLYQSVVDYIEAIDDPMDKLLSEIWFNDSNPWERNSPDLVRLGAGLGLSETDIDNLFIEAAAL